MKPITGVFFFDFLITLIAILGIAYILHSVFVEEIGLPQKEKLKKTVIVSCLCLYILNAILAITIKLPFIIGGAGWLLIGIILYHSLKKSLNGQNKRFHLRKMPLVEYFKTKHLIQYILLMDILVVYYCISYVGLMFDEIHRMPFTQSFGINEHIIAEANVNVNWWNMFATIIISTISTFFLLPHLQEYYRIETKYDDYISKN